MTGNGTIPVTAPARDEPQDSRLVTILFAGLCGAAQEARTARDASMERAAARLLSLLEIIITRNESGQVLQGGADSLCAVFNKASEALNRSLEIQRAIEGFLVEAKQEGRPFWPRVRIGLHMGEVLLREEGRVEIVSRQVIRARQVMEAAGPGQVYASEAVIEAGRDFIEVPGKSLSLQFYGEYHLPGTGVVALGEVVDLRFCSPAPPKTCESNRIESTRLGRLELAGYRSLKRVGEGPMGVTYEAIDETNGHKVAIKALTPSFLEEAGEPWRTAIHRLEQLVVPGPGMELDGKSPPAPARLDSRAGSPASKMAEEDKAPGRSIDPQARKLVLPVVWRLDHQPPFLVREWIEGRPLDEALKKAKPERIARVFLHLCELLEQSHAQGLAHLNLKPGNLLVRVNDQVTALDWGLREGVERALLNSAWAAPEQVQNKESGPTTDIYAVGAILFKVLTGREPFTGDSVNQVVQAHLYEDPPLPSTFHSDVPDPLQRICLKALEKAPEDRYASMREMANDLNHFLRGEMVRTRPTAYDNLLFHRVSRHIGQVREWMRRGLLTVEESNRLMAAYEGLQRRGVPAAMESRVYPFWQTLVYIGGWAVVNGALLWLALHWSDLGRVEKLLLGSLPAVVAFALGFSMMRLERFRLAFVAYIVGVVAVPLLAGVWLHEFQMAARVSSSRLAEELFYSEGKVSWLTNGQIFWAALLTAGIAAAISFHTRTTTHSAQAAGAGMVLYASGLLFFGLKPHAETGQWAVIGLQSIPLLLITGAIAGGYLRRPEQSHQSEPWIYCATGLVLGIFYALSLQGLEQWTHLEESSRQPASLLLLAVAGAMETALGLLARERLKHRARAAVLLLVIIGLGNLLGGLALAGHHDTWPSSWPTGKLFGNVVPLPHLLLPPVSLLVALLACRFQMFSFLGMGLAGFAGSVHMLGELYFKEVTAWPRWIMLGGVACFLVALFAELRRARSRGAGDSANQFRL